MASNGAAQTAQAQQGNQQQAEQFLQQQQQKAFGNLQNYMAQHPNPVNGWGPIQGPQMQGGQMIGGGTVGPNGAQSPGQLPGGVPPNIGHNRIPMQMQGQAPQTGSAASGLSHIMPYLQLAQMMQQGNQTQMHGGGIG